MTVSELVLSWVVIGALVLFLGAMFGYSRTPRSQARAILSFSKQVGLTTGADEVSTVLGRFMKQRTSSMYAGSLLGLMVSAVILALNSPLVASIFVWLIVLPAVLTGMATGAAIYSLRESLFPQRDGLARIARPSATTARDYVSPWRLRLAPIFQIVAAILCAAGLLLGAGGRIDLATFLSGPALPFFVVSLVVTLAGTLATRRILLRRQPVAESSELFWDDAVRAETLRGIQMGLTIVAWFAVSATVLGMLQAADTLSGSHWSLGLGLQPFAWGTLGISAIFAVRGARAHFRQRLWPDFGAAGAGNASSPGISE